MMKGTTPTHIFTLPFDTSIVKCARVIYKQYAKEVLRKDTEAFKKDGSKLSVDLSQEETFLFSSADVTYQLRVKTIHGKVLNTKPKKISVEDCLDCEVL